MKHLFRTFLLALMCMSVSTTEVMALDQSGNVANVFVSTIFVQGSGGSYGNDPGDYHYNVSGVTQQACDAERSNAMLNPNVSSATECQFVPIDLYFNNIVYPLAVYNGRNNTINAQIEPQVATLASQYDLSDFQDELKELEHRYNISEYKTNVMEIYREAHRSRD